MEADHTVVLAATGATADMDGGTEVPDGLRIVGTVEVVDDLSLEVSVCASFAAEADGCKNMADWRTRSGAFASAGLVRFAVSLRLGTRQLSHRNSMLLSNSCLEAK